MFSNYFFGALDRGLVLILCEKQNRLEHVRSYLESIIIQGHYP